MNRSFMLQFMEALSKIADYAVLFSYHQLGPVFGRALSNSFVIVQRFIPGQAANMWRIAAWLPRVYPQTDIRLFQWMLPSVRRSIFQ